MGGRCRKWEMDMRSYRPSYFCVPRDDDLYDDRQRKKQANLEKYVQLVRKEKRIFEEGSMQYESSTDSIPSA
jgi:hypothetical protein